MANAMTSTIRFYAGLVLAVTIAGSVPAAAEETCWSAEHGQFFNMIKYCVSSVRASEVQSTYGPENLARWEGDASKAWCTPDFGFGETIRIEIQGGPAFRRLAVGNGYAKSPETEQFPSQSGGDYGG